MSIGTVLSFVVPLAMTGAALRPPQRPYALARLTYRLTLAVVEMPHLFALLVLASTAATVVGGTPVEVAAALVVAAVVLTGLTAVAVRGVRAADAVGAGFEAAGLAPPVRTRPWWRVLLTPVPVRPRTVERIPDLAYGPHRRNRLDVYRRRDHGGPAPVLVYLHGGGYVSGSKHHEGRPLLHHLAERGWVCVSATYRLRPEAGFAEHLSDARSALAWVHRHAAELGGDPERVVMAGSSAGAHLTAHVALGQHIGGEARGHPTIAAGICLYGYYGRYYGHGPDEATPSTPFALDPAGAPPLLICHGSVDSYTSAEEAARFAAHVRSGSANPVVHAELPGGQHGFDIVRSWRMQAVLDGVDALVAAVGLDAVRPGERAGRR